MAFQSFQALLAQAYIAAPPQPLDLAQYPNTSAANHIVSNFGNMTLYAEQYCGSDQLHVGNGQGFPIHQMGSSSISSPSRLIVLKNKFHIPTIQKHFLFVSQFTKDNHVSIEFHPSYMYVKDQAIGTVLLCGPLKQGIYLTPRVASSPSFPLVMIAECVSVSQWHYQLSHLAFRIVCHVLSQFCVQLTTSKTLTICLSCQQAKSHNFYLCMGSNPVLSLEDFVIMFHSQIIIISFVGFFPLLPNLMSIILLLNFKPMLSIFLNTKLKFSSLVGVVNKLFRYFSYVEISHHLLSLHTHQQNKIVERKHHHIIEVGLAIMTHSSMPQYY